MASKGAKSTESVQPFYESSDFNSTIQISEYFGENVFGPKAMAEYLNKESIKAVQEARSIGKPIEIKIANQVAEGMKNWAMNKGATHYTHWFQPLRGSTAEKHDSFFEPTGLDSGVEKFSGKALVQQEPDASSFPSGGIRNTFEARGYSAWDPSSPAFIMEKVGGKTLCIPTIFVAYTGEALDHKSPLIKSINFLTKAAVDVCQLFDSKVKHATISLGIEQEYFIIDADLYAARPDLCFAGRTLVGSTAAKGQQLEDHYFGSIPDRIYDFMMDFEYEAFKLGIPLKTRHNEVAPGQYECAPMFEEADIAIDHNSLLMDVMENVAGRHNLKVILHEKPFKGVNGSGKHNNWSIITDTGVNLLSPGLSPQDNFQFLTIFINTIKAVYDHADLMRASIATAANDHRLGANEAPPAIMSVFIGSFLSEVLNTFESDKNSKKAGRVSEKTISLHRIPEILLDNTDRNRTSPFAFTGNKFEFRAVGSSDHCASAIIVLNTIVGNQLMLFKKELDALIKKGSKKQEAIEAILRGYIKSSKKIIFEGNGYSNDWVKEAAKRGLNNIKTTPYALDAYMSKSSQDLFINNNIFSHKELEARTEIKYEGYTLKIQIEGRILGELAKNYIIPSAVDYQKKLVDTIEAMQRIGQPRSSTKALESMVGEIAGHINSIWDNTEKMTQARKTANNLDHADKKAKAYCDKVIPYFEKIRESADKLEEIVDNDLWKLPKYRELLFIK
ncbi:MAG: glutamine synthetase III [Bacteroidia bacterium]|nr:glutamine synthetase III [Bacteroidia bacterium]